MTQIATSIQIVLLMVLVSMLHYRMDKFLDEWERFIQEWERQRRGRR